MGIFKSSIINNQLSMLLRYYLRDLVVRLIHLHRLISRLLRFLIFFLERRYYLVLNLLAAVGVYRMGYVRVQLHPALHILSRPVVRQACTAVVAELRPKVVLPAALLTMVAHLP